MKPGAGVEGINLDEYARSVLIESRVLIEHATAEAIQSALSRRELEEFAGFEGVNRRLGDTRRRNTLGTEDLARSRRHKDAQRQDTHIRALVSKQPQLAIVTRCCESSSQ